MSFPPAALTTELVTVFPSKLSVTANLPKASTVGLVLLPASDTGRGGGGAAVCSWAPCTLATAALSSHENLA